ncbi:MAG: VTC domain-containing protein [Planctomycetota bacterium]
MAANCQTIQQRFEYKYLITEAQAEVVRGYAAANLAPDPHTDAARGHSYPVYTLYLDTADLALYHSSRDGEKNRFKLRIRSYDGGPETPAFLEVKARCGDTIQKRRAPVRQEAVARVLGGFCPSAADLATGSPEALGAACRFCELGAALMARPTALVRYVREAYVEPDGGPMRLTIDRAIACRHAQRRAVEQDGPGWVALRNRWVVLEIKFTDTFPLWASEMVRALALPRTSSAKYVESLSALMRATTAMA